MFQRPTKVHEPVERVHFVVFEKFTSAYLFQIARGKSCDYLLTIYYSFKIFSRFWLAKSPRLIHHNQLLMTKFGRFLCLTRKWKNTAFSQVKAPLTEKTWGRGWVVLVVNLKNGGHFTRFKSKKLGEKITKNMARTARRQLEGRHLLFGE